MGIKIRKIDVSKYDESTKKIKALINRAARKGIDVSSDIAIPSLSSFTDRQSFNKFIDEANRVTNKDNWNYKYKKLGDGSYISEKSFAELQSNIRIANSLRDKKRKKISKIEARATKDKNITSKYEQGSQEIHNLPTFSSPSKIPSKRFFDKQFEYAREKASPDYLDNKSEIARQNFLTLVEQFVEGSEDIRSMLQEMDIDEFWDMYKRSPDFGRIFYESSQETLRETGVKTTSVAPKLTELQNAIEEYYSEKKKSYNE